jgi:phosphate starvation-inducible PhoH-like protein
MAKSKKSGEGSVEIGSMERKIEFKPRKFKFSEKQKQLLDVCLNPETKAIFITGPAGSSKTYMAVYAALNLLAINKEWDMTYIRSLAESADRGIGSLPGTVEEKFMPFLIPLEDKMDEIITAPTMVNLRKEQIINVLPVNFVRGSSWTNKVVICDEAQNFSRKELITLVTRIGEQSKIFICGDLMQSDIRSSGFNEFVNLFDDEESRSKGIHVFKFDKEDIYRSEILKFIVEKLEQLGKKV